MAASEGILNQITEGNFSDSNPSNDLNSVSNTETEITELTTSESIGDSSSQFQSAEDPKGFESVDAPINVTDFGAIETESSAPAGITEAEKPRRDFFIIRVPRPDLTKIITSIKAAEQKLKEKKEKQQFINAALNLKKAARSEALTNLKQARDKFRACITEIQNKFNEIKPLQEAIRRFQDANSVVRNRTRELQCSSEFELDLKLSEMEFKLQHESLSLSEEKKVMKDMKTLENSRAEIRENEALSISVSDSLTHKEVIQARLKPLLAEVEIMKMEREAARKICDSYDADFKVMEKSVSDLFADRAKANQEQDDAYHALQKLRQEYNIQEQEFRQNNQELFKFRQLAANNDVKALEELCNEQVERIHSKLNEDKEYRTKFYKDMEFSLMRRFGSLDTRRLTMEEETALKQSLNETKHRGLVKNEPAKPVAKPVEVPADVSSAPVVAENEPEVRKVAGKGKLGASNGGKEESEKDASVVKVEISEEERKRIREEEIEKEKKLKEKRREEEMAKAKEAEERKRRLKEKAQKKAEIKALKDAEELALKKEKEKERKSKKLASKAEKEKESKSTENEDDNGDEEKKEENENIKDETIEKESHLTKRQRKRIGSEKAKSSPSPSPSPLYTHLAKKKKNFWNHPLFLTSLFVILVTFIAFVYFYTQSASSSFQ